MMAPGSQRSPAKHPQVGKGPVKCPVTGRRTREPAGHRSERETDINAMEQAMQQGRGPLGRVALVLAVVLALVLGSAAGLGRPGAAQAAGVPAGLPSHFGLGVAAPPDSSGLYGWLPNSGVPWDYAYQYLAGGVNTGAGWETWNADGQFPLSYAQGANSHGAIPVFNYYEVLQSMGSCDTCPEDQRDMSNLNTPSLMASYFQNYTLLMQRLGTGTYGGVAGYGKTAIVHIEGDLSGYAEHAVLDNSQCFGHCSGQGNNPAYLQVAVASTGVADVAGYPNTYQGFNWALLHLRDKYAPNVRMALHLSNWATGADIGSDTNPATNGAALGQEAGSFLAQAGMVGVPSGTSSYDLFFNDPLDRDAGYYQYVYNNPTYWWDRLNVTFPNFQRWEAYITAAHQATGRPAIIWQIPVGNQYFATENNSTGHYQDNRVEYFFGHLGELQQAGIIGLLFGAGNGGSTVPSDGMGDGVTNPPSFCTADGLSSGQVCNNHTSASSDDDGGYLRMQAAAYYASGPLPIGGGPSLAASYVSVPPITWSTGQTQSYKVTVTNTGSQTWNASGSDPVHLGIHFVNTAGGWLTDQRFTLPSDVGPGASATITAAVTAPAGAGSDTLTAQMVKELVAWFPQSQQTSVGVAVAGTPLAASYVSSPPTNWSTGQSQTYQVTVTNTGSQTWNATGSNPVHLGIHFVNAGGSWLTDQRFTLPNDVAPSGSATITVNVTAPSTAGSATLAAQMVKELVAWFPQMQQSSVTVSAPAGPALAAAYTSTPPTAWSTGQTQSYQITVTNTGSQTWNAGGSSPVHLGIHFINASGTWLTDQRFVLPSDVAPGASATLTVSVQAPATTGSDTLTAQMVKELVAWFPQSQQTPVTVGAAQPALAASYTSSPPTTWATGQTQTYQVTVTNTGSQGWNASGTNPEHLGVHFVNASGTWLTDQRFVLPNDVAPGASATLTVSVQAPSAAGSYTLTAQMVKELIAWFPQSQQTAVSVQ